MSLFQNSVLNKYLKGLESEKVNQAYERFINHFHNPTIQENIRNSKEEQYQGEFLIDLFVNVLGYTKNPTPEFNLTTELKNIKGSKKTDGAILKDEKALAVIELKGTNTTDLSKVETQAFGYKNNQPGCNYVITSNFEKLRFYIDNAVDFEEFNLFKLSKERFDSLWLCLSSEYLLKDIPKKIKDESLTQEENVTKKLYKDYASFRNEIFDAIQKENPEFDKLTLFKKTQKLLDRFLFIFFAEDRLLLPPNSIRSIVNQWTDLRDKYDEYFPLYDRFKKYFGYMNTGHKGQQHDIFAYNGGLFAPDEILDNIKINDDLLHKHTINLSNYDFESEVSVNILGHIFEHSLNDIDEIQAEIQGVASEQSKTKRKKDGVFYTPKYITKYIVDNTVGKLCEEKKTELDIQEAEYEKERKGRQKATLKKLTQKLEDYRKWLLQITICDPACGSGAFLNQALEFLIAEHQYIDELQAKLFGDAMVLSELENSILENNLFGVDINEESVEIAKLSLWLRTAQKGRKLTSLNNNIKCGNSLIDDPTVAGEKAFIWKNEFPEVFAKGGFDVIIGNPPYVRVQNLDKNSVVYFEEHYKSATGKFDIYVLFNELSIELLKERGLLSFIQPHRFINADFGKGLKNVFESTQYLNKIISFSDIDIFQGATTYTAIFFLEKKVNDSILYKEYTDKKPIYISENLDFLKNNDFIKVSYSSIKNNWEFKNEAELTLLNRLRGFKKLSNIALNISQGVIPGSDKIYYLEVIEEQGAKILVKNQLDDRKFLIEKNITKSIIKGNNIKRYALPTSDYVIIYPYTFLNNEQKLLSLKELEQNYPLAFDYLSMHKEFLINLRKKYKTNPLEWYGFHRAREMRFLEVDKLITSHTSISPSFTYATGSNYFNQNVYGIEIKKEISLIQILGILNSKLSDFYIRNTSSMINGGYFLYKTDYISNLPIITKEKSQLISLTKNALELNSKLSNHNERFLKYLSRSYRIEKFSKKLENWNELDFGGFIKELNKAIKKFGGEKFSKSDEIEWMEIFDVKKNEGVNLIRQISKTEREIDQIVYELFGLTLNEIKVVEEATA